MQPHLLITPRTARYYLLGTPGPHIRQVWFCLHGENQPVPELAAQLVNLDTPERLLILPEALSRYGLPPDADGTRRVGADWFAVGDLLPDFTDLTTYLDTLSDQVLAACPSDVTVTVLGVGHGGAAACRWLGNGHIAYDRLILYAAVFPPEIDRRMTLAGLPKQPVTIIATTTDSFKSEAQGEALYQDLQDVNLPARLKYVSEGPITLAALGTGVTA